MALTDSCSDRDILVRVDDWLYVCDMQTVRIEDSNSALSFDQRRSRGDVPGRSHSVTMGLGSPGLGLT